ncbi:MAG: YIP1 family protein [Candidatus Heimdallarchaeum endolithica]|uniref:YIP1 family protein n=1 Tax=Candidatus Heimdallarchaeum endolithica TaxID=2876572 RepID=A0A9Y1FN58_9ARCH|nr:MAG: YIP1 family protein [Candidatus Heimdallarchaeum endolithica]
MESTQRTTIDANSTYKNPLKRIVGHLLFSYDSFLELPNKYLLVNAILIAFISSMLVLANILVLISKFELTGTIGQGWIDFKNNLILSALLTPGSLLLWALLMHSMLSFMGGKGKFLRSLAIYCIAQIPVIIGDLILLIVAFTQPTIIADGSLDPGSFTQLTGQYFHSHSLASLILTPFTILYSNLVAGIGMSAEHKAPELLGWISGGIIALFSILLRIFV